MVSPNIYVSRRSEREPSFTISNIFKVKEAKGEVGIEIEVEGNKFPKPPGLVGSHSKVPMPDWKYWSYCHDGSLRGKDNAEYVLTDPIQFSQVDEAVSELFSGLSSFGSILDESNRTSVHVHLNFQNSHLNRLATFCGLWFCFEEILTEWCGDHRVGNLFCLRGKDAPAIPTLIREFIKCDGHFNIRDNFHYSGLNVNALQKFGSLEIRTMRGATDPEVIKTWLRILERFYKVSLEYADPRHMVDLFSSVGPLDFFHTFLGSESYKIINDLNLTQERIYEAMFDGIRLAQDVCYCRAWEEFNPITLRPDPFGRSPKKVAGSLADTIANSAAYDNAIEALNSPNTIAIPSAWYTAPTVENVYLQGTNFNHVQTVTQSMTTAATAQPIPTEDETLLDNILNVWGDVPEASEDSDDEDYNPVYEE